MLSFLKKNKKLAAEAIYVDIHSHLLPGIDDGVSTFEEALLLLQEFQDAGYKKLIITPHVYPEFYPNTSEIILKVFNTLKEKAAERSLSILLEAAAEYFVDDEFAVNVSQNDLLFFGNKYLLFETSFLNPPERLNEIIFKIQLAGYKPVMAHPERYNYIHQKPGLLEDLSERGVLFQLNINSLAGVYSSPVKKMALKMIDNKLVHFLGSDCHHKHQFKQVKETIKTKPYKKALNNNLLNNTLL